MSKYVLNICAGEAADIQELGPNTVMISINEEAGDLYPLSVDPSKVLRLRFSDVRAVTRHTNGIIYKPMSPADAQQIMEFVSMHSDKKIIVHCAAGVSRSAAIALFIHKTYGHELKPNFWKLSDPNPFIYGTLMIRHEYAKHDPWRID